MIILIGKIMFKLEYIFERCICKYQLSRIEHGINCHLEGKGKFTNNSIKLGNNVTIGSHSIFLSSNAKIIIGNYVMFGPHVLIATGDHRTDVVGEYMYDVSEKNPDNDKDVIIDDDVWVGMGSIILKGVHIGEGAVIGAGSVVVKDVNPYEIYVGNSGIKRLNRFRKNEMKNDDANV